MIVIGLTGLAGAGKDTVADVLVTHAGFTKLAFADRLRLEVAGAFALGDRAGLLSDREGKEQPTDLLSMRQCKSPSFIACCAAWDSFEQPDWDHAAWAAQPRSPREVMQLWGTEYRRAESPTYWLDQLVQRIKDLNWDGRDRFVVSDVRFGNEAAGVRMLGGEIWRIHRPGQKDTAVEGAHASRTDGRDLSPECTLLNLPGIDSLAADTLEMLLDRHCVGPLA